MDASSAERNASHLGFLDGIRGGAALWVLLAHCMIWGGWYGIPIPAPKIAVDIFMIVSGFLMVYQYRSRETVEPIDMWRTTLRFWVRRFFRIAPVYYLVLIIVFAFWDAHVDGAAILQHVSPELWQQPSIYDPAAHHMDWTNTLVHATFLFGLLPKYAFSNMTPDWSIGLEMQFYVAFPLLYILCRRFSWLWIVTISLALSIVCNRWFDSLPGVVPGTYGLFPEPSFLLMKLPLFLIGMLAAEIYCLHQQAPGKCALMTIGAMLITAKYAIWVSVATGTILWLGWSQTNEEEGEQMGLRHWVNALLSNRCAKFMADSSYCVYLIHGFFITFVGGYIYRQPDFLTLSPPVRVLILAGIVCLGSYLTAALLHPILEKPGISLGRWAINHWFPLSDSVKKQTP